MHPDRPAASPPQKSSTLAIGQLSQLQLTLPTLSSIPSSLTWGRPLAVAQACQDCSVISNTRSKRGGLRHLQSRQLLMEAGPRSNLPRQPAGSLLSQGIVCSFRLDRLAYTDADSNTGKNRRSPISGILVNSGIAVGTLHTR